MEGRYASLLWAVLGQAIAYIVGLPAYSAHSAVADRTTANFADVDLVQRLGGVALGCSCASDLALAIKLTTSLLGSPTFLDADPQLTD